MGIGERSFILELEVEQPEGGPGGQSPLGRLQYDPVGQFGGASRLRVFVVNPRPLRPDGLNAEDALAGAGGVVAGEGKPKGSGRKFVFDFPSNCAYFMQPS